MVKKKYPGIGKSGITLGIIEIFAKEGIDGRKEQYNTDAIKLF